MGELSQAMSMSAMERLTVRLVRFERHPSGRVEMDAAVGQVVNGSGAGLGLADGAQVMIRTSAHPLNANTLLHDLIEGDRMAGVPECGPGSLVTFSQCTVSEGFVEASSFRVEEAIRPDETPSMTPK